MTRIAQSLPIALLLCKAYPPPTPQGRESKGATSGKNRREESAGKLCLAYLLSLIRDQFGNKDKIAWMYEQQQGCGFTEVT